MNTFIDIYCERTGPGLWAEPLNALSNAAFIIAAILALMLARRVGGAVTIGGGILITLIFAMGVGSTLFHTFATRWAMMADVLPILIFQISFIILYSRHIMGWAGWKTAVLLLLFMGTMAGAMQLPRDWLNGSLEYAPALIFVTGLGLYHYFKGKQERWILLLTALIFTVSMTFRSIDDAICNDFPLGVHYIWHCLNAVVLYLSARAYIVNMRKIS